MSERYYCPEINSQTTWLTGSEAHHALHVMRHKAGDVLEIFDGTGQIAEAIIKSVARTKVELSIQAQHEAPASQLPTVTVAACCPKGDRLKVMVEKLTEIGVSRYVPLQTERSVVTPRDNKLDRLSATVVSAAKQCGRPRLMEIVTPMTLSELLPSVSPDERLVAAHPHDHPASADTNASPHSRPVTLLIGPEGGFTKLEVQSLRDAHASFVAWPEHILRTETAAVVFATMLLMQQ